MFDLFMPVQQVTPIGVIGVIAVAVTETSMQQHLQFGDDVPNPPPKP